MRNRLVLLNLILLALLGAAGWQLRERWRQAKDRRLAVPSLPVPPRAVPAPARTDPAPPLAAAAYAGIATRMVFARDRNPNVVVEEIKPEPPPALPVLYGAMHFGGPATVILSEKPGSAQKSYRSGDKVGGYTLSEIGKDALLLEWKDKKFEKKFSELKAKEKVDAAAQGSGAAAAAPAPVPQTKVTTEEELAAIREKQKTDSVMIDTGGGNMVCVTGDTSPAGTIRNGYRKVVSQSPFGARCYWERIR